MGKSYLSIHFSFCLWLFFLEDHTVYPYDKYLSIYLVLAKRNGHLRCNTSQPIRCRHLTPKPLGSDTPSPVSPSVKPHCTWFTRRPRQGSNMRSQELGEVTWLSKATELDGDKARDRASWLKASASLHPSEPPTGWASSPEDHPRIGKCCCLW